VQKQKYTEVTRKPTNTKMLKFDDQEYERVKEFEYLAAIVTEDNDITTEIDLRITVSNRTSVELKKQLNSSYLKRQSVWYINPLQDRYLHMEVNGGLSQRRMKICSKSLKEEY
jgi:hypothetical protein